MDGKNMEFQPTFLRVCIDQMDLEKGEVSGYIGGVGLRDIHSFGDTPGLLLLIDQLLDQIGKPQATRRSRSFRENSGTTAGGFCLNPPRYHTSEEIRELKGECKTVDIQIITRLHSSWQGFVYNSEGEVSGKFSSDLQLLGLIVKEKLK